MKRPFLRISLILCFAAACFFSGATRAPLALVASLAIPSSGLPGAAEEEESLSAKQVTETRRQIRTASRSTFFRPKVAFAQLRSTPTPFRSQLCAVIGHRLDLDLLAPLRL